MLLEWNDRFFDRLCKSVSPWNSHAGLGPLEASNNPNEIHVLNWGLIWSLRYSSDEEIIEMITEIKFAIINLSIHSQEERLTCFDCKFIWSFISLYQLHLDVRILMEIGPKQDPTFGICMLHKASKTSRY